MTTSTYAQNVGINATGATPDASAMLDIVSANRGLLVPRVALTSTNAAGPIAAPTTSLLVYNTATAGAGLTAVTPGYYYWDGAAWVRFQASNTIDDWKLLGNSGTTAGTNFVGTTDAQHLDFRTNSTQRMRIMNSTHPTVGIGTAFPVTNLSGTTAVVHIHDGGGNVGSQLILSNSSTTSGDRAGLINFSATQVTNDRRTASIESYLTNYTAPNATGDLRFFTNNANSYTEKMRIEGDGDVGIGATPDASAKLDISATNKGLLAPRVALTATNAAGPITAPATGLLVYNSATAGVAPNNVVPGFYYWDGASWVRFDTGNNIGDWKILGNANTTSGTNFLGTTNAQALDFRTNNTIRFRIANGDQVLAMALGTAAAPFYSWNVDANTGMFSPGADVIGFSTNSNERFRIPNANQVHAMSPGTPGLPFYSWDGDVNTGMYKPANDNIGLVTNGIERIRIEADGDIGIGTAAPDVSAKLDVTATDRGLLAPRVALTATNAAGPITTPATGLLVYNTATAGAAPNNVVPGYYYNSGTPAAPIWRRFSTGNGEGWQTTGNNGTNPTNNFIGTIDNQSFVVRTNNVERMRVLNTGEVGINTTTPARMLDVTWNTTTIDFSSIRGQVTGNARVYGVHGVSTASTTTNSSGVRGDALAATGAVNGVLGVAASTDGSGVFGNATHATSFNSIGVLGIATRGTGVFGQATGADGWGAAGIANVANGVGVYGQANGTAGIGIYGTSNSANGFGMFATNTISNGTGMIAIGNNAPGTYLIGGSGVLGIGTIIGIAGFSTSNATGTLRAGGYFETNAGQSFAYVGARTVGNVVRKIEGNGTVNTVIKDLNNDLVVMSAPEAPENLFQDFGEGELVNGKAIIKIDPIFSKNIIVDSKHPLRVFIQLKGDCNGVFVTNESSTSFEVIELQGGNSNVKFTYFITANRADEVFEDGTVSKYSEERFAPSIGSQPTNSITKPATNLESDKSIISRPIYPILPIE